MEYRKLPFGYCMQNGQICVLEQEAEVVRMIFASYAEGNSYEKLAGWLNSKSIPFSSRRQWNKNTVGRLLQDKRYLGTDPYPPIIALEAFASVKPSPSGRAAHPWIKHIRALAHCAVCGGPVRRVRQNTWRCPNCMSESVKANDRQLMESATELLRELCMYPSTVMASPSVSIEDEQASKAREDFDLELDNPEFNESTVRSKAFALAAAQFNALDSSDYETIRIQYILGKTEQTSGLDTDLLRQITSAILILPNGEVRLELKNGQIIERSNFK